MTSSDNKRLIRIHGDRIDLTSDFSLNLANTNLPWENFTFRSSSPFFWEIELIGFDRHDGILTIHVTDYYPLYIDSFRDQRMKNDVKRLHLESLEWQFLEPFLNSYHKQKLKPFIIDSQDVFIPDRNQKLYEFTFKSYFKDARFKLGYVSCFHYVPMINEEIEFRIPNSHAIPEFDFIKNYFSRILKRKTFQVHARIKMAGYELVAIEARSPQISKIDHSLIDSIKTFRVLQLQKDPFIKVIDKSLFTTDEVFGAFSEEGEGNVFQQNAADLIQILTSNGAVRNRKQIQYLAGKKQSADQKIYITLRPVFGFVFFVEGRSLNHLCWELLNSHATYLWSFDKTRSRSNHYIKRVEKIIQTIREQGRVRYKQAYHFGHTDSDILFQTIVHQHAESSTFDSFPGWKHRLEEKLV